MFRRVGEHVWVKDAEGYSDRPVIGYIQGEKTSLLFESGASGRHAGEIKDDLDALSLPQPSLVAISHWHWDHSFGLFSWSCPTIAGKKTNSKLKTLSSCNWDESSILERIRKGEEIVFCHEMMKREYSGETEKIKVVPASIEFDERLTVDLGGVCCTLIHTGGPHSRDSVVLLVHEDQFLFLGDSAGKDLYTFPWHFDINREEEFLSNISVIPYQRDELEEYKEKITALDFKKCIPGHSEEMDREEFLSSLTL